MRRLSVILKADDAEKYAGPAFVAVARKWAPAIAALIRLSDEYRHAGLLVTNVGPGGNAAIAGVARGDILLRYDGVELDTAEALARLTSRAAGAGNTQRRVAMDAVRSGQEMTFHVAEGLLGITVSELLHRLDLRSGNAPALAGAGRPQSGEQTLVEVRGELARKVLFLTRLIERPGNSIERRKIKALLSTAAAMA
jgi:hypothetical protein